MNLAPPGYRLESTSTEGGRLIIKALYDPQTDEHCPKCGKKHLRKWGTRSMRLIDVPRDGMPAMLIVTRHRYQCGACGAVVHIDPPDMQGWTVKATQRMRDYVARERDAGTTIAHLADELGVSLRSMRNILDEIGAKKG